MEFIPVVLLMLYITTHNERSFVSPATIHQMDNSKTPDFASDSNEKELESLKDRLDIRQMKTPSSTIDSFANVQDKTLEMVNTHTSTYRRNNQESKSFSDTKETVNRNGELVASVEQRVESQSNTFNDHPVARIQTDVEIPSEGVHKSVVQEIRPERPKKPSKKTSQYESINKENDVQTLPGVQYTPFDMAEYVFWTGDEKGVTSAVEEFLKGGLMSREEAISFLQEIKNNLDYLENRYNQMGLNIQEKIKDAESNTPKYYSTENLQREHLIKDIPFRLSYKQTADKRVKKEMNKDADYSSEFKKEDSDENVKQEDYEELLEKLKVADFLYTEYSLEEVIYQLAKIMFKQSLAKENSEAQQALYKFIMFLETEAEQGHITRALEKRVLDVLIAALMDTLSQYPELMSKVNDNIPSNNYSEKQEILRKIIELNPDTPFKITSGTSNGYEGNSKSSSTIKYAPLGYGKYSAS